MNPQLILAVALGGAIGSVTRHLISILSGRAFGTDFPWGIFIINVTGSFLIGAFIGPTEVISEVVPCNRLLHLHSSLSENHLY